jgi:hypothetical protein
MMTIRLSTSCTAAGGHLAVVCLNTMRSAGLDPARTAIHTTLLEEP